MPEFREGQRVTDKIDGRHGTIVVPKVNSFLTKVNGQGPIATVRFVGTKHTEPIARDELEAGWR
jgi:hypothetical protein